ncbi:MAG: glycosyltransferase family 39 protein [Proteobacteria bacterium]|nr:glycosyltransferase family 39 protein [Pseudomonadota bacterium]
MKQPVCDSPVKMAMPVERLWLGAFIVIVTIVRLWFGSDLGLAPDEAYYWQWSTKLGLSYPDHPPLIAWLIRLGTWTAGENSLGVRLPCILIAAMAVWVAYILGGTAGLSRRHAALAAALSGILPAPAVGSVIATPDTPLGICWLLALLALARLIKYQRPAAWYLLGASAGFGILAKHTGLLIPLTAVSFMIAIPRVRTCFRTMHPWLASILALSIALPYFITEAQAGFPSVSFQLAHITGNLDSKLTDSSPLYAVTRIFELIGGQIGLLTPLVAGWAFVGLLKGRGNPALTVLASGLLIPIAAAGLSALFTHPEQNWASLGHPAAGIIAILAIATRFPDTNLAARKKSKVWISALVITAFAVTALIHSHAANPFLPLPPNTDPVSRLHGWNELSELKRHTKDIDAIICDNYGLAAETAWHMRSQGRPIPTCSSDRPCLRTHDSVILLDEQNEWQDAKLDVKCKEIHPFATYNQKRPDGKPVRTIKALFARKCGH